MLGRAGYLPNRRMEKKSIQSRPRSGAKTAWWTAATWIDLAKSQAHWLWSSWIFDNLSAPSIVDKLVVCTCFLDEETEAWRDSTPLPPPPTDIPSIT